MRRETNGSSAGGAPRVLQLHIIRLRTTRETKKLEKCGTVGRYARAIPSRRHGRMPPARSLFTNYELKVRLTFDLDHIVTNVDEDAGRI